MPWTQTNSRYQTNEKRGFAHGPGNPFGSVFRDAIINHGGHSLWLEHIIEPKKPGWEGFWLMWYNPKGEPNIKESAVFDKNDLHKLVSWLADPREAF